MKQPTLAEVLDLLDDVSAAFENVMATSPPMPPGDMHSRLTLIAAARQLCDSQLRPNDSGGE